MKILNHPMNILSQVSKILGNASDLVMIEQTLWLLGNITGESKQCRDIILQRTNIFDTLDHLLREEKNLSRSLVRTVCWVNTNINRDNKLNLD